MTIEQSARKFINKPQIILLIFLLLVIRISTIDRLMYTNVGSVLLNKAQTSPVRAPYFAQLAENAFRQAEGSNQTQNTSLAEKIGLAILIQGEEQQAISLLQKTPDVVEHFLLRGGKAVSEGDYDVATYWYRLASEVTPMRRDTWYYLGLSYSAKGDGEGALPYYEKAIALSRIEADKVTDAELYCATGWIYHWVLKARDPASALHYYNLALSSPLNVDYPDIATCYFKRASLLMGYFNDSTGAIKDYKRAIELDPNNIHAMANLVVAEYLSSGDFASAEHDLLILIVKAPDSIYGYWRLGDMYMEKGDFQSALIYYRRALDINPNDEQLKNIITTLNNKN